MWKLFKTDGDLQKEVDILNLEYKHIIDKFCIVGRYVFIFKGFVLRDGKIKFDYIDTNTPKGYTNSKTLSWFKDETGKNIIEARSQFIILKGDLEKLGIELKLLNNE
jgi:hypothetical protein